MRVESRARAAAAKQAAVAVLHDNQPGLSSSAAAASAPPATKVLVTKVRPLPVVKKGAKPVAVRVVTKELHLIEEKVGGRIKSYHVFRGWGFIVLFKEENGGEEGDVFFCSKDLNEDSAAETRLEAGKLSKCITLKVGQVLTFDLFQDAITGKFQAKDIRGENGGLLEPDEAWALKTDRDNLTKRVAKLTERIEKLKVKKAEERGLCILCKDQPANIMFVPCNHIVACEKCYKANTPKFQSTCMVCRAPVGDGGGRGTRTVPGAMGWAAAAQEEIGRSRVGTTVKKVFMP